MSPIHWMRSSTQRPSSSISLLSFSSWAYSNRRIRPRRSTSPTGLFSMVIGKSDTHVCLNVCRCMVCMYLYVITCVVCMYMYVACTEVQYVYERIYSNEHIDPYLYTYMNRVDNNGCPHSTYIHKYTSITVPTYIYTYRSRCGQGLVQSP